MNVVFVGGGSFRTLPIVRGVLQNPKVMDGGEIRLVDFNLPRVETVGRLIMATPEFAAAGCKIVWTDKLEEALPGADVVSISFPVGSHKVNTLSDQACAAHGLFGSDQISASGAFRSVTGGTVVLGIARQMEKHCPDAWLFDYANPVAVYSGIVNNHTGAEPVSLSNVRVLTANCGSRPQGFLQCSDPLLNEIYEIATQTVISSVDDTFTDCPTFEQVNWNYDNRAAFLGEILICANTAVARHSIALFAEDPEFAGLVRSQYPSTWDNFIPLWSMHWIMWCRDYVELTGDLAFGRQMYPRIRAGIEEALGKIGDRGLLEWDGVWHFVEWGHGRDDGHAICGVEQAGLAGALEAAVRIANLLGETDATAWNEARTALVNAINRELWDESRGAYADSLHADGTLSPVSSQTTNAMMGIYGVADDARAEALAQRIVDNDPALLAYGSPYGLYYVLELFDRFEMVEPIFAAIRHRWGDMVLDGDRTTWETFAEYGGHGGFPTRSRCHPFAAYVVRYLVKYLLGVSSWNCGESPVAGKPNPPSGITFCRGAVPTPQGLLPVGWDARNSALR